MDNKEDLLDCIYGIQYILCEGRELTEKDVAIIQRALSLYATYLNTFGITAKEDIILYHEIL